MSWKTQNKRRPGAILTLSVRAITTMAQTLDGHYYELAHNLTGELKGLLN